MIKLQNFLNKIGIKSVEDSKTKMKSGEMEVNDKIVLGKTIRKDVVDNIPRKEIYKTNVKYYYYKNELKFRR